jgi:hypothetical protein
MNPDGVAREKALEWVDEEGPYMAAIPDIFEHVIFRYLICRTMRIAGRLCERVPGIRIRDLRPVHVIIRAFHHLRDSGATENTNGKAAHN